MWDEKSCNGCFAMSNERCLLGYKIEPLFFSMCFMTSGYKPLEPCPKPTTYEAYIQLLKTKKNVEKGCV